LPPRGEDADDVGTALNLAREALNTTRAMSSTSPFARLDWLSRDRFDGQWHRHTGEWFCLYRALSLAEALDVLVSDELLHPL